MNIKHIADQIKSLTKAQIQELKQELDGAYHIEGACPDGKHWDEESKSCVEDIGEGPGPDGE